MKKLFILLLLSVGIHINFRDNTIDLRFFAPLSAQHMYREASDNCLKNNLWYQVIDLCDAPGESAYRCDYCGLYYQTVTAKNTHKKVCKYRPHIEYDYDKGGNRTAKRTYNYHHGRKIISYNESRPYDQRLHSVLPGINTVAILLKRDESEDESSTKGIA